MTLPLSPCALCVFSSSTNARSLSQINIRHRRHVSAIRPRAATSQTTKQGATKRPTVADLKAKIEALEDENRTLRTALAAIQGCSVDQISMDLPMFEDPASTFFLPSDTDTDTTPSSTRNTYDASDDGEAGRVPSFHNAIRNMATFTPEQLLEDMQRGIVWPSQDEHNPPFYERPARATPLPVSLIDDTTITPPPSPTQTPLHVVHVTAEMAPCAKVGGLGDVVTGLSKAFLAQGHYTEVILPYYECLPDSAIENLEFDRAFECPKGKVQDGVMHMGSLKTLAWRGSIDGVPVILLRPDWEETGSNLFRGGRIYGGSYNETEAYLYFCRAALEYLVQSGRRPHIIHAHEWQASAVPMLYWECFANALSGARPALTIHNMDNSGECRQDEFAATGVAGEVFADVNKALDERTIGHNPERLCLLKGGMVYSSVVTTVSPTYANETLTGGSAGWLRSTLARPEVANKYWGVLNGIDVETWNPATDPLLPANFSSSFPQGKALCKQYLQQGLGMDVNPDKPLVAVISRLVPQKGVHLIEHSVGRTVSQGGQFVLLGTGHAAGGLHRLAEDQFKDSPDVKMIFGYSERLAHLIYAAADIFLVPSMFEPCGLTQMIALRYGAVPVVRSTGGLADTVRDVDSFEGDRDGAKGFGWEGDGDHRPRDQAPGALAPNGFVFGGSDAGAFEYALDRALDMYLSRRGEWEALKERNLGDGERWSWTASAKSYIELYSGVLAQ